MDLNDIEHLLILVSVVTNCVTTSAYAWLLGIPIGTAKSAVVCAITKGSKKYKSRIKNKTG